MTLSPLLLAYDQVILDLDGTVWIGAEPTPRAAEAVAAIRAGVFVIGGPPVFRHVVDAGHRIVNHTAAAQSPDIVVAVAHAGFDYAELRAAVRGLLAGAELICGGRDRIYPASGGPAPGTGAIAAALEYASGVTARAVGKPDPQVFALALDRLGPGRTLVIGDHLTADLAGAAAGGLDAAIVLSGATTIAQARAARDPAPVAIARDLATLVLSH